MPYNSQVWESITKVFLQKYEIVRPTFNQRHIRVQLKILYAIDVSSNEMLKEIYVVSNHLSCSAEHPYAATDRHENTEGLHHRFPRARNFVTLIPSYYVQT